MIIVTLSRLTLQLERMRISVGELAVSMELLSPGNTGGRNAFNLNGFGVTRKSNNRVTNRAVRVSCEERPLNSRVSDTLGAAIRLICRRLMSCNRGTKSRLTLPQRKVTCWDGNNRDCILFYSLRGLYFLKDVCDYYFLIWGVVKVPYLFEKF